MTVTFQQQSLKQGEGSFLPLLLLAAISTAVVVVRQTVHHRRLKLTSKVGQWEIRDHDDEDMSELTTPLQEDQDMTESDVDLVSSMAAFREGRKSDEDHSNDGTEQTDTTFQSETMEL